MKSRFLFLLIIALIWYSSLLINITKPTAIRLSATREVKNISNNTLKYPSVGISAPITISPGTSPLVQADWNKIRQALKNGVSVSFTDSDFDNSPLVFITGHSSDTYPHTYSSIFAGLGQTHIGDQIMLNINNKVNNFIVIDKKVIEPTDTKSFNQIKSSDPTVQRIALVTCWPVLTTRSRLVVVAERKL